MSGCRLEARFVPGTDAGSATIELALVNTGGTALSGFSLAFSAMMRIADDASVSNARFMRRIANFHEFSPPEGLILAPGDTWRMKYTGLTLEPQHRLDGPKSAYLTLAGGTRAHVDTGDLIRASGPDTGELKCVSQGELTVPLAILPWPASVEITAFLSAPEFFGPAADAGPEDKAAMARIAALAGRLFPASQAPFRLDGPQGAAITFQVDPDLGTGAYRLELAGGNARLSYGDKAGRDYGLTVLAQISHGARADPARFSQPSEGSITDAPRFGWRGSHLDVSRHFWGVSQVRRVLDILAWSRMNVLQWHLTDDEAWRLEIKALPELIEIGACRGPDCVMVGQGGFLGQIYAGHYSQDEVREIIAHAAGLNIDIVPEIDIPGHCTAVLHALPHLRDPGEPADSYRSIQGYANNALNPAMPATYEFLETVFGEVAALFPSPFIHVGADEVDHATWLASPLAQGLMAREGLTGTMELQAHLLRRAQKILQGHGKRLAGWDEVAQGGGVGQDGVLLVAWREPAVVRSLIEQGYEVVASPGQAYYMDMAQGSGWNEPGASWAGVSTPEHCYRYEPGEGLTAGQAAALKGVQAGIWCEHLTSPAMFNHMVFPRLNAVAEAGWTPPGSKDWLRFAAISRVMPQL